VDRHSLGVEAVLWKKTTPGVFLFGGSKPWPVIRAGQCMVRAVFCLNWGVSSQSRVNGREYESTLGYGPGIV